MGRQARGAHLACGRRPLLRRGAMKTKAVMLARGLLALKAHTQNFLNC